MNNEQKIRKKDVIEKLRASRMIKKITLKGYGGLLQSIQIYGS